MSLLEKLQPASFKGVRFLIDSTSTTAGRKTVTHEYPNRDSRFVEDLGALQETYSITGIVSGENYIADRDALIAALKSSGRGELVHPFFGSLQVTAKPFSLSENLTELGIARFSMTFEKSEELIYVSSSSSKKSLINQITDNLSGLVGRDLTNLFSVNKKYPLNFLSAKQILTGVTDNIGLNANEILKTADEISSFVGFLNGFSNNIVKTINDPSNLGTEFQILFRSFSTIGSNAKNQFDLIKSLFNYGNNEPAIPQTTIPRVERETNRQIINSAVNINALAYAYNTVPVLDITTDEDIKKIEETLEVQFNYIMQNNNVSDETIQVLKDLRVEVSIFLKEKIVNTFKISTIQTKQIPMTILAYQYYGNVNNTVALLDLNQTINSSFVEGDTKILTI
jgi:prophage DNA circulation protein